VTIQQKRDQLIATLSAVKGFHDRFASLVEQGKARPALDAAFKNDRHKVDGCLSNLWFVPEFRDGKCYFAIEADSLIVKAIASLLCDLYSGYTPEEILSLDPSFLAQVGITQHLSPNRRNSLSRVWDKIRAFARENSGRPD
jgi:cysteine desulfuration protein SufE